MSHNLDFSHAPVGHIAAELGRRLNLWRISRELREIDLAREMGVSRPTLRRLLQGASTSVETLIRALTVLGLAENLDLLVPDIGESPMARLTGGRPLTERQRVRPAPTEEHEPWSWNEGPEGGR